MVSVHPVVVHHLYKLPVNGPVCERERDSEGERGGERQLQAAAQCLDTHMSTNPFTHAHTATQT